MLKWFKVHGQSMSPQYNEGDLVLAVHKKISKPNLGEDILFFSALLWLFIKKNL
jgi:signal peptidase I